MKVIGILISIAGFVLMMAGVGTLEFDNTIAGWDALIYFFITLIGLLSWIWGMMIATRDSIY